MFRLITIYQIPKKIRVLDCIKLVKRGLLSPAYYCNEVWQNRLNQPLFQKINLDELYHELEQKFQRTKNMSFIDVDLFVNAVDNDLFDDEMLDLVHKLRLTAETSSSLPSLSYAVIRTLLKHNKVEDLLTILDDRLNYGVFLYTHTSNILLDYFWEKKDFVSGARIASQSMLQEDPEHPITHSYSLLHCFNCLLIKGEWSQPPGPEEPEEEIKVRVKYIRNEYDDQHFDLKDCKKIIGKTLMYLTKEKDDGISNSFFILGASLFGDINKADQRLEKSKQQGTILMQEILDLIIEDQIKAKLENMKLDSANVNSILESNVSGAIKKCSEIDIANQCNLFKEWDTKRLECLREKEEMFDKIERMKKVESLLKDLKERETKLWFFENEEKIELEIQEKQELQEISEDNVYRQIKKAEDEVYIPPSVRKSK